MRFYTLSEKIPSLGKPILIKMKEHPQYYVVTPCTYKNEGFVFEESSGEQYAYWKKEDVIGWCSLDEIERNEVWN